MTDIDYHTDRNHAKSLAFIQATLGRPIGVIPPLIRICLRTQSLQYYFTTNMDEILFHAAAGDQVAAYPTYVPMSARFVYLHGRASTADSVHRDLVLGNTGYESAYNVSPPGAAKSKLTQFAHYPVVFMGFSMNDPYVVASLEEIARSVRLQRNVYPHDELDELISPLKWYIILRSPTRHDSSSDRHIIEDKRRREDGLNRVGVQVIWFQDGGASDPYRGLLDVAQLIQRRSRELTVAEQELGFVERLIEAEDLAAVDRPTANDIRRSLAVVEGHSRVQAAFWEGVDGLHWYRSLLHTGALHPKPVVETASGGRRAPFWHAARFVRRIAALAPAEVCDFISTVATENWAAVRDLLGVFEALEESCAMDVAAHVAQLVVRVLSIDDMMLYEVSAVAQRLDSDGGHDAARGLLQAILCALVDADPSLPAGCAADFSEAVAPILAKSESGISALCCALRISLERRYTTPENDDSQYSRPAIEAHRTNFSDNSVESLLIDVVRDSLQAISNDRVRREAVTSLLYSTWPTERRIGIAHCFLKRSDLPVHESEIITQENLANQHLFHELAKLVSDDITDISEERIDRLKYFVESLHNSTSEQDRFDYQLWSRVLPIELLPSPPEPIEDDDEDPDRHLFRGFYFSSVSSLSAPLDNQSFAERAAMLSPDELVALVRDPAAHGVRVTLHHSTSEMWSLLAEYTQTRETLGPLLQIRPDDLQGRQVWPAIKAMAEIAGDDPTRWNEVLDWARGVITELAADQLWPISGLLEGIGTSIPLGLSDDAIALAMQVLEKARRTQRGDTDSLEHSFFGGYLNRPAGKAMGALLELLRRELVASDLDAENPRQDAGWFKDIVLDRMDRDHMSLGIDAWVGVGLYFALLSDRYPDAVTFVVRFLESETSESSTAAIAFWSGHLSAPTIWTGALERLQDAYQNSARTLQTDGVLEDDLRDRFFQHIVIGALRDISEYDEILLSTLETDFTPAARGSIVFALGRAVREMSDSPDTELRTTVTSWFQRYWNKHVQMIGGSDGPHLAGYLRWLRDLQLPPQAVNSLIEGSLDQTNNGFDVYTVFEYLGHYAEESPVTVIELLGRCVDWYRLRDDVWLHTEKVKGLLDRLVPLTRSEPILRDVLDGLAELGAISTDDVRRYLGDELT